MRPQHNPLKRVIIAIGVLGLFWLLGVISDMNKPVPLPCGSYKSFTIPCDVLPN